MVTLAWRRARNVWWGRVTPRAANRAAEAACWYTPAPGPTGEPTIERTQIGGYLLLRDGP